VGVEEIVARAGVAKMTFYRHFPSKQDLVLAFLERREARWTHAWLEEEVRARAPGGSGRLLAVFDVFDEWFNRTDFEGCSFINVLLEIPEPGHSVRKATVLHLANIRGLLREFARDARVRDAEDFSRKWHILMKGSIVAAGEGDTNAAHRAQEIGRALLAAESDQLAPRMDQP
jgi:AcrR family transcriptional regulator